MKKLICILLALIPFQAYAGELSFRLVDVRQIGHSDGYDAQGFVGTGIYRGTLLIEKDGKIARLNSGYTLSERKKAFDNSHLIIGEMTSGKTSEKEILKLKEIGVTPEELERHLKSTYKSIYWE